MGTLSDRCYHAIEAYASLSLPDELMRLMRDHPELQDEQCGHEYPDRHYILDVKLGAINYAVLRCQPCGERFSFVQNRQDNPGAGVPLGIRGRVLRHWVNLSKLLPTKGHTDWDEFQRIIDSKTDEEIAHESETKRRMKNELMRRLFRTDV